MFKHAFSHSLLYTFTQGVRKTDSSLNTHNPFDWRLQAGRPERSCFSYHIIMGGGEERERERERERGGRKGRVDHLGCGLKRLAWGRQAVAV